MTDTIDAAFESESRELVPATTSGPLVDLRAQFLAAPADVIRAGITEYVERRNAFREGLKAQLVEGVHFGYPPYCKPKVREEDGYIGVWIKGKGNEKGYFEWFPPEQWTAKPSLYKAGADFVCDFLNLVAVFDADIDAWTQLGKVNGTFVIRCRLYPKNAPQIPENLVGEGRGVRRNGQKGGDENNALKMAQKCARVDAVLNSYGLSDLFTQDIEDQPPPGPEEFDNPQQTPPAQTVQPRGERVTAGNLKSLFEQWSRVRAYRNEPAALSHFQVWASETTGIVIDDVMNAAKWNVRDFEPCNQWIVDNRGEDQ